MPYFRSCLINDATSLIHSVSSQLVVRCLVINSFLFQLKKKIKEISRRIINLTNTVKNQT